MLLNYVEDHEDKILFPKIHDWFETFPLHIHPKPVVRFCIQYPIEFLWFLHFGMILSLLNQFSILHLLFCCWPFLLYKFDILGWSYWFRIPIGCLDQFVPKHEYSSDIRPKNRINFLIMNGENILITFKVYNKICVSYYRINVLWWKNTSIWSQ